jgi:hypothetical protein
MLRLALMTVRGQVDLGIGLDWGGRIQGPILNLDTRLGASSLTYLMLVVLEREEKGHIVRRHILLASTSRCQLSMHHRLRLKVMPHFSTLNVNGLRYAIVLIEHS